MIHTTLNRIKAHGPCEGGWKKLLKYLGKTKADDARLSFATIVKSNGLADALWCCRVEPQYAKEWRLYAVWCARQVQHMMIDPRSVAALDVAKRHAHGEATDEELAAARATARATFWAANRAVEAAARADAWEAARATAWEASFGAVWEAAWDAQRVEFLRVVTTTRSRKP
jgi:hypothetical protein